jgi:hypothetical protein
MKKFIGTILLVASTMLALLTGIGTFIIGFKILKMLWFGAVNPILCLQFLGFVLALGIFMALATLAGKMCNVDVNFTSDTIVGKHEGDDDDGYIPAFSPPGYVLNGKKCTELLHDKVDYDSTTWYPSSKMGTSSLDPMAHQYINNLKSKNERLKDDE